MIMTNLANDCNSQNPVAISFFFFDMISTTKIWPSIACTHVPLVIAWFIAILFYLKLWMKLFVTKTTIFFFHLDTKPQRNCLIVKSRHTSNSSRNNTLWKSQKNTDNCLSLKILGLFFVVSRIIYRSIALKVNVRWFWSTNTYLFHRNNYYPRNKSSAPYKSAWFENFAIITTSAWLLWNEVLALNDHARHGVLFLALHLNKDN